MKVNRYKALLLWAGGLSCVPVWAAVPGAEGVPVAGRQIAVPVARDLTAHPAATSNETLIHLHRAAIGIDYLPPALSGTAERCCEPSRASR